MQRIVELTVTMRVEFSGAATAADMMEIREQISHAVQPALFNRVFDEQTRSRGIDFDLHFRDKTERGDD